MRDEAKAKGLIPPGTTDFDGVDRYGENDPFIFNGYRQEEYDAFYARYPFLYQKGDWTHFEWPRTWLKCRHDGVAVVSHRSIQPARPRTLILHREGHSPGIQTRGELDDGAETEAEEEAGLVRARTRAGAVSRARVAGPAFG